MPATEKLDACSALLGPRAYSIRRCDLHWLRVPGRKRLTSTRRLQASASLSKLGSIVPKIDEVDRFLRAQPARQSKFWETHPEVLFFFLNGRRPLIHKKKRAVGLDERLALLSLRSLPDAQSGDWARHG